jgi:hypothetical protein
MNPVCNRKNRVLGVVLGDIRKSLRGKSLEGAMGRWEKGLSEAGHGIYKG